MVIPGLCDSISIAIKHRMAQMDSQYYHISSNEAILSNHNVTRHTGALSSLSFSPIPWMCNAQYPGTDPDDSVLSN